MTTDYGTYRLSFNPPSDHITPSVEMTLSGEATVDQMLYLFESFLKASGYVLKGDLQIVEDEQETFVPFHLPDFDEPDFPGWGAAQPVENPWFGGGEDMVTFKINE